MIGLHGGVYKPPPIGGAIAQLGERLNGIQEVVGSIPIGSTTARLDLRAKFAMSLRMNKFP